MHSCPKKRIVGLHKALMNEAISVSDWIIFIFSAQSVSCNLTMSLPFLHEVYIGSVLDLSTVSTLN